MSLLSSTAQARARLIERAPAPIRGSYRLRRAGRRVFHRPRPEDAPERPIGAKLELTYHCNLRCSFCYTDSPRRTIARTAEMSDQEWRRIVAQTIELGVIEVVLTGGEPLLRKDLALECVDRLSDAGIMVTLNTNGWFLDPATADRLAATRARIHVSLDGASAELHDASRGVPGGWRRAVEAADLMLSRGSQVQVVHVVTPQNAATFEELLEQMRVLAPTSLRVVPVGLIGAAARDGAWGVDFRHVLNSIGDFGHPARPRILAGSEMPGSVVALDTAPRAYLVRPNGAFLADSQHPFSFGDAAEQDVAECWSQLRGAWRNPRVTEWRAGARSSEQAASRSLVAYRDDEEVVAGTPPGKGASAKSGRELELALEALRAKMPEFPEDGRGDIRRASAQIRGLALARRFRLGELRWGGSRDGSRLVRVIGTGEVKALNRTAGIVMEALDGGSAEDAIGALTSANPRVPAEAIERDALEATSSLLEAGIVVPTLAPGDGHARPTEDGYLSGISD